jgi:hypothetical protein
VRFLRRKCSKESPPAVIPPEIGPCHDEPGDTVPAKKGMRFGYSKDAEGVRTTSTNRGEET